MCDCFSQLETCCGCCSVETGSKIIACLQIVATVFMVISFSVALVGKGDDQFYGEASDVKKTINLIDNGLNLALAIPTAIVLTIGAFTRNSCCLVAGAWLMVAYNGIGLIKIICLWIYGFTYLKDYADDEMKATILIALVLATFFFIIGTFLNFYFAAVVCSFAREIREGEDESNEESNRSGRGAPGASRGQGHFYGPTGQSSSPMGPGGYPMDQGGYPQGGYPQGGSPMGPVGNPTGPGGYPMGQGGYPTGSGRYGKTQVAADMGQEVHSEGNYAFLSDVEKHLSKPLNLEEQMLTELTTTTQNDSYPGLYGNDGFVKGTKNNTDQTITVKI